MFPVRKNNASRGVIELVAKDSWFETQGDTENIRGKSLLLTSVNNKQIDPALLELF